MCSYGDMKIEYRDDLPLASAYAELFETTGWNKAYQASAEELSKALRQSWCTVSAYEGDCLVGFGRVVSDGVLHALVCDLIVPPSHQHRGIGSAVLARLVEKCTSAGIRDVQLFSAAGKSWFYKKRGFKERASDAPGMQLSKRVGRRT
jgi:N-acetylglutamate synthase-like GNAT family acetyltransferase